MADDAAFLNFPPVTLDDWRAQAERELKGASLEGLRTRLDEGVETAPLYSADDTAGALGRGPLLLAQLDESRSWAWRIVQEYRHPDPQAVHAALHADGPQELSWLGASLVLDQRLAAGFESVAPATGLVLKNLQDIATVTPRALLEAGCQSTILAGCMAAPIIAGLVGLSGSAAVRADPLGAWARFGALAIPVADALKQLPAEPERGWITRASSVTYHDAGATPALELALALATGIEYLRALTARGVEPAIAAASVEFELAIGRDLFTEIAKLRAARLVWSRVLATCGLAAPDQPATSICARGSWREQSRRDPWNNLLRATTQAFSAVIGGADQIVVPPFDDAFGPGAGGFARRIARNIQLILREEAHLERVADPAGGSWYVESLTEQLARASWRRVQAIEAAGGLAAALRAGVVQGWIGESARREGDEVARAKRAITGVNRFPQLEEPRFVARRETGADSERAAAVEVNARAIPIPPGEPRGAAIAALCAGARLLDVLVLGADSSQAARERAAGASAIQPLAPARLSEPFERLRARVEGRASPPVATLMTAGELREYKARADYLRDALAAGGIALREAEEGAAAPVAILCARDDRYPDWVPGICSTLRAAGTRLVLLAGRPPDPGLEDMFKKAGVDGFLHRGCDLLAALERVLAALDDEEVTR